MNAARHVVLAGISTLAIIASGAARAQSTTLISATPSEAVGNRMSLIRGPGAMTPDARYIVFSSQATDLDGMTPDTNGFVEDIYLRDRIAGTTRLVSVMTNGQQGSNRWFWGSLSDDGGLLAYGSYGDPTMFLRDMNPPSGPFGTPVTLVRRCSDNGVAHSELVSISGNGRHAAFISSEALLCTPHNGQYQSYVVDVACVRTGAPGCIRLISQSTNGGEGSGNSADWVSMDSTGRFVVFGNTSANLTNDPDCNGTYDAFLRDRDTDADGVFDEPNEAMTFLVSIAPCVENCGASLCAGNNYSAHTSVSDRLSNDDGPFVAFDSLATNLVPGDTNGVSDVFLYNFRTRQVVKRVSVDSSGMEGNGQSYIPTISRNGRFIVFSSQANNLVLPDVQANPTVAHVFLHDRDVFDTGTFDQPSGCATYRVDVKSSCEPANDRTEDNFQCQISDNGRFIAFTSWASNLTLNDTNNAPDVFIRDRGICVQPAITMHPSRVVNNAPQPYHPTINVCPPYQPFVLRASAMGDGTLSFRWYRDGQMLSDSTGPGTHFTGTDTAELTITPSTNPNDPPPLGSYKARVTNGCSCGLAESRPVALTFLYPADVDDGSFTGTPDGGVTIDDLLYYLYIFESGGCGP